MIIRQVTAGDLPANALADLLVDVVDGGASVGFLRGLTHPVAATWWWNLEPAVEDGTLLLWVAEVDGRVVGTVQLRLATLPNSRHRAELAKLLVHRSARGRGIGKELMRTAEEAAHDERVTLLLLDTETGSPAEGLYTSLGWTTLGVIPDYALSPDGVLSPTTFLYKALDE
ncbi:GNAT family N-acetyltransferase [Umezawaea sp. NPDC059074]|uniref:GNAT family N-acetyltransferase n=1 Tax=Umezawaea sp. NPDC059074 TaxID=3346716 RepID=UPI0036780DF3